MPMGMQDAQEMADGILAAEAEPVTEQPPAAESTPTEQSAPPAEQPAVDEEFTDLDRAAMAKVVRAEREQRKDMEAELKRFRAAEEEAKKAAMSDLERAVAEAKAQARAEAEAEYKSALLKARVEAKTAGKFHDPDIVFPLLEVDADATDAEIDAAVAALAESRPYLVKQAIPNLPQGPRGDGSGMQKSMDDVFREALTRR